MKIQVHKPVTLAGKDFDKGSHQVPNSHAHTQAFKALVKSGHVSHAPRSEAEQALQAQHDARAQRQAAELARNEMPAPEEKQEESA